MTKDKIEKMLNGAQRKIQDMKIIIRFQEKEIEFLRERIEIETR